MGLVGVVICGVEEVAVCKGVVLVATVLVAMMLAAMVLAGVPPPPPPDGNTDGAPPGIVHIDAAGVSVSVPVPVTTTRAVVTEHVLVTVAVPEIVKSADAEVSVALLVPAVTATITLVAFTVKESAVDPDFITKFIPEAVIGNVTSAL